MKIADFIFERFVEPLALERGFTFSYGSKEAIIRAINQSGIDFEKDEIQPEDWPQLQKANPKLIQIPGNCKILVDYMIFLLEAEEPGRREFHEYSFKRTISTFELCPFWPFC